MISNIGQLKVLEAKQTSWNDTSATVSHFEGRCFNPSSQRLDDCLTWEHTPKSTCWKRIFIIIQLFNRDKHCKKLQGKFGNHQSFNKFHVKLCGCNTFEGILRSTSTRTKQAGDVWCDVLGVDSFCLGGAERREIGWGCVERCWLIMIMLPKMYPIGSMYGIFTYS